MDDNEMTWEELPDWIDGQFDGPHSPESVRHAARAIEELVRYLNNATQHSRRMLPYAPHVYRLVGNISSSVSGLEQLLDQIDTRIDGLIEDSTLYDDRRTPQQSGRQTAEWAAHELDQAQEHLARFVKQLQAGRSHLSHLGHDEV